MGIYKPTRNVFLERVDKEAKVSLEAKIKIAIIVTVSFLTIGAGVTHAAWWEEKRFPVPPNTEEVKQQVKKIAGSEFKFTYYISAQDKESIMEFYRRELNNLGWSEKNLQEDLAKAQQDLAKAQQDLDKIKNISPGLKTLPKLPDNIFSGPQDDAVSDMFFGNNLVFEKEKVMLTITFLPQAAMRDGKTKFSVSEGKLDLGKKEAGPAAQYAPELLEKPKKNVTPLYPGAVLVNLSEKEDYLKATYFTKGYIEEVADFYREKMPGFGWSLINEIPINKVDFANLAKSGGTSTCPECEKNLAAGSAMTDMWFMELGFSNSRQDTCKIGLFYNAVKSEQEKPVMNFTTVRVEYEKNK